MDLSILYTALVGVATAGAASNMARLPHTSASFKFYYDIVCPFAYMSSTLVEGLAKRCGATVSWTPVLLGKSLVRLIAMYVC